jgi:hypothetical protein
MRYGVSFAGMIAPALSDNFGFFGGFDQGW